MIALTRLAHLVVTWAFAAGVLVQGYLAGSALTQLGGTGDFGTHIEVGYTVMGLLALAVPILALLGRYPRAHLGWSGLVLVLYIIQISLPNARDGTPAIAALHPANAMLLFVLAVAVAVNARRMPAWAPPAP